MRFIEKTAAGIDISEEYISIALLRAGKNGLELVRSATAPMPQGAIKDGNIEDAMLLAKAIKELKHRCKIREERAAVSLFARPFVVQIIDMPKQVPPNIRQYVQGEVRNCVALPSRDVVLDFCQIGTARRTAGSTSGQSPHAEKRVLAVAAEEARMLELVRVCGKAGFNIETIEPPLFAYMRGLYSQKVAGKNALNVLVAMLRGTALTLGVFKNGSVDFVRTKEIPDSIANSADLSRWLADELSDVVRFYDIEVPDNMGKWDVTVFVDARQSAQDVEKSLKSAIQAGHLQVRTIENACLDTPVSDSISEKDKGPSPVAVGLAMRLLTAQSNDVKINLVPQRVIKTREARRDALVAANIAALVFFVMILAINGFVFMIERVTRNSIVNKKLVARQDTELMLEQQQQFDGRLNVLSDRINRMAHISTSHNDVNWVELLDGIKNATPGSVLITSISCQDGSHVLVEGLAMSNEAVNLFVGLLEKAHGISAVTLLEARKQDGQKELITYQLSCKLGNRSGKAQNVS